MPGDVWACAVIAGVDCYDCGSECGGPVCEAFCVMCYECVESGELCSLDWAVWTGYG